MYFHEKKDRYLRKNCLVFLLFIPITTFLLPSTNTFAQVSPIITITHPLSPGAQADTSYLIGWQDDDPDSNAVITLYYDTDNTGTNGTQIITGISEDDEQDYYDWNVSALPQGARYYIYAKIEDGNNPATYSYSSGAVIIDHRQGDGRTLPWRTEGVWLMGDIHNHTVASDGSYNVGTVAEKAKFFGADFIAITDHGDDIQWKTNLKPGTVNIAVINIPIESARKVVPDLIIFEGIEWNVPGAGYGGHAVVLVTNSPNEHEIISSFTTTFDNTGTNTEAIAGLQWLATHKTNDVIPICSLNHPSRPTYVNPAGFSIDQLRAYNDAGGVCIGFSGDVGHKKGGNVISAAQLGGGFHDPMTAWIGNNWDTLLNEGRNWWIRFESDFHHESLDYWPGEFTQIRVYSPSKTYEGVIKGLQAGCAYAVHNNIITDLDFLGISGTQSAMMGEVIEVVQGNIVTASIRVRLGTGTIIDKIELISNESGNPASTKVFSSSDWKVNNNWLEMSYPFTNIQNDFYFRIRGSSSANPVNLWFYSNPIRVKVTRDTCPLLIFTKEVITSMGTASVSPGATLTYTLNYTNIGAGTSTNVIITDAVPAGTTYITNSAAGDNTRIIYSHNGGVDYDEEQTAPVTHIRWNLTGDIAPNASGNVYFDVKIE